MWLRVAEAAAPALVTRTAPSARASVAPSRLAELPRVTLPPSTAVAKDAAGIVSVRVEDGLRWFVRPDALQGYEGDVTVGTRATESERLVSFSGTGTGFLRAKEALVVIELRDEEACVRASALVAHAATLTFEATDREVVGEFDEDILRFLGLGTVVLEARAELMTLPVGLTHATTVRWDNVVGWMGHVIGAPSDSAGADGRALARFAGNGSLLLSMHDESASTPAVRGEEWYGRYQVLRRLEHTPTEEVLLARSHGPGGFQRKVILRRCLARYGGDSHFLELLAKEADAHALLAHSGIVRLYDFLLLDGHPVLVLEYVSGVSLAAMDAALRAQHRSIGDPIALYIAHCVFTALAAAHSARDPDSGEAAPVFHRDVRPGTVLLGWNGDVKLASFASARVSGNLAVSADVYVASLLLHGMLTHGRAVDPAPLAHDLHQATGERSLDDLDVIRPDLSLRLRDAIRIALTPDADGYGVSAAEMAQAIENRRRSRDRAQAVRRGARVAARVGVRDDEVVSAASAGTGHRGRRALSGSEGRAASSDRARAPAAERARCTERDERAGPDDEAIARGAAALRPRHRATDTAPLVRAKRCAARPERSPAHRGHDRRGRVRRGSRGRRLGALVGGTRGTRCRDRTPSAYSLGRRARGGREDFAAGGSRELQRLRDANGHRTRGISERRSSGTRSDRAHRRGPPGAVARRTAPDLRRRARNRGGERRLPSPVRRAYRPDR